MMNRTKTALVAAFILVITSACSAGGGVGAPETSPLPKESQSQPPASQGDPNIPATGGLCGNDLYPIKQGATWTYSSTGGPGGDFIYTDTITAMRPDGFTLSTQFSELARTQEWSCETDGLKALELGNSGATASISAQGMTAEFTTSDVSGISLPREVQPGMQWQYSLAMQGVLAMPGDQQAQSTGTYSVTMQEMGRETITVPAGAFEAVKIQTNYNIQVAAEFQGIQVPITVSGSSIVWYASGIGYIKSIENSDFGDAPYTVTTELLSYSIP
ncbi:MAG: hypothetical protein C4557_02265 [Anaerolineaceae bacterium]|jgi:hypothetical protein|nr:MAG: hypothetical protein C4557_02265 [Anaerolineaceae bacterium]